MERDPVRLAWKTTPFRHVVAVVLLVAVGILLLLLFSTVRTGVDDLVGARGGAGSDAPTVLFRFALDLPPRLRATPVVVLPGFPVDRRYLLPAALSGFALLPVLIAIALSGVGWIGASVGARVLARLRTGALSAMLNAAPAAREEAAQSSLIAGNVLARESFVLGFALLAPLQRIAMIAAAMLYTLAVDWRLALALGAMLIAGALVTSRRLALRSDIARVRRHEGAEIERSLMDLLRRLPALRAHGTGRYERDRLGRDMIDRHRRVSSRERRLAIFDAMAIAALLLTPLAVLGTAFYALQGSPRMTAGTALAVTMAATLAALAGREMTRWERLLDGTRAVLADLARSLAALQTRERRGGAVALPRAGALVAAGVSAYDGASGGRITGVDLSLAFPAHVALVGDGDAGPRVFAALIGGQLEPSTGRLTYGGSDLAAVDPVERAHRIAYAGGDTILIPGSLRQNLLYGCPASETDLDTRLTEAVAVAGLDRLIHARGLAGTLDPRKEPKLAAAVIEARHAVQAALAAEGLDRFVDPFDVTRYNQHATIGENLLFGKPIGDTFREDNLASHPFVRAILEAEDLTKPLARIGLSIATSMIEIFADVPDGHPLFERFSFFSASDRAYFEDLVERRTEQRRGAESARDRERLIGLALRYSESRHRLGLVDDALRDRLTSARADFAKMLPLSLKPAIEFYDKTQINTAASIQDNLLFGRVASEQAGADAAIQAVIRRVLTERGLDADVSRIGLESPVDTRGGDLTITEIAAVDLVRCLVRRPDVVIAERVLDGLPGPLADALVARLRRALVGRGLMIVTSDLSTAMDSPVFDAVIRFERGTPALEDRRARVAEPVSI
jgi:ABC-type multidrug transport system fused ATPase/permease subunit